jgi:hypothetical protein
MTTITNTQTDSSNNIGETFPDNIKWLLIGIGVGVGTMLLICLLTSFCIYCQMNKRNKIDNVKPFTPPAPFKQNYIRTNEKKRKSQFDDNEKLLTNHIEYFMYFMKSNLVN